MNQHKLVEVSTISSRDKGSTELLEASQLQYTLINGGFKKKKKSLGSKESHLCPLQYFIT